MDVVESALQQIARIHEIARERKKLDSDDRHRRRPLRSASVKNALHRWMRLARQKITDGSATAEALDHGLQHWGTFTRFVCDLRLPANNNWSVNQIRPIAIGRSNWLLARSLLAGKRAAAATSLASCARMNGSDALVYLRDVLTQLPNHLNSQIKERHPHRLTPKGRTNREHWRGTTAGRMR